MLQTRVQDGQIPADSSLQHSAALRNTAQFMSSKSVAILAFLIAILGLLWWVNSRNNASRSLSLPAVTQQANPNKLQTNEEQSQLSDNSNANASETAQGNTNSVKVETTTSNGVTNTTMEVNGEQVPVNPNGTTRVALPGGGQSVTNVTTQNTQTGGSGFNFNSNTSTSSSSSFTSSSQKVVGGP